MKRAKTNCRFLLWRVRVYVACGGRNRNTRTNPCPRDILIAGSGDMRYMKRIRKNTIENVYSYLYMNLNKLYAEYPRSKPRRPSKNNPCVVGIAYCYKSELPNTYTYVDSGWALMRHLKYFPKINILKNKLNPGSDC